MNVAINTPKINLQTFTETQIRIGLVGFGFKGGDYHKTLKSTRNVILSALSDSNESVLSEAGELGIKNLFKDYREMIKKINLDAIIISTPHNTHFPIADYALENNLHLFIEKPLTINLGEAKYLLQKAKRKDLRVMVGTQRRFESPFSLGKNLLSELGRTFSFRYNYTISCDLDNLGWRGSKKTAGGGALIDMGYHPLDILIWYCGLPEHIYFTGGKLAKPDALSEVEDTAILMFDYGSNLAGYIFLSRGISPEEEELKINGDRGSLLIKRGLIQLFKKGISSPIIEFKETKPKNEVYLEQVNHFRDGIINRKELISDIGHNILNMTLVEAAYKSQRLKKPINPRLI